MARMAVMPDTSEKRDILAPASYPANATELLGQASVASALFTGHTKIDGRLSIQLRSSTALRTLFAECTAAGTVRGIVQGDEETAPPSDLRQLGQNHRREPAGRPIVFEIRYMKLYKLT